MVVDKEQSVSIIVPPFFQVIQEFQSNYHNSYMAFGCVWLLNNPRISYGSTCSFDKKD